MVQIIHAAKYAYSAKSNFHSPIGGKCGDCFCVEIWGIDFELIKEFTVKVLRKFSKNFSIFMNESTNCELKLK